MNKRLFFPIVLAIILFFFLSSSIAEETFTFDKAYYREGKGIYIDTVASPISVKGQQLRFKWGYDIENVSVPYKFAKMPFWIEHNLPFTVDLCNGKISFKTTYPTSTYINWDYNVFVPNYKNEMISEPCAMPFDATSCYIDRFENYELVFCDGGIKKDVCKHTVEVPDGTFTAITRSRPIALSDMASCPLDRNRRYNLYHYAEIPVGSEIIFDVSLELNLSTLDKATFVIPAPSWTSVAANDYNAGNGYDFNWTKVTWDGNIMPTGDDRIHNDQNQVFYDANLIAFWKFNDKNSTGNGILDDTNRAHNGHLINGADINARGMWDTNAAYLDGVNDRVAIPDQADFDMNSGWTITGWFNMTGTGDTVSSGTGGCVGYPLVTKGMGEAETRLQDIAFFTAVRQTPQTLCADIEIDTNSMNEPVFGSTVIRLNRWYHFAAVFDPINTVFAVYLDGVQDGSRYIWPIVATQGSGQKAGIGVAFRQDTGASDGAFKGYIDDAKIYDRILSVAEIQADYNNWMKSNYFSPVKDAGAVVNWDAMDWNAFVDVNNSVTVDYRGCSTADCSTAGDWQTNLRGNPPGTWETNIYADNNRYFQYKVNFDTNKQQWNAVRSPAIADGDKGKFGHFSNVVVTYSTIGVTTCDCPTSGHWNIGDASICTLSTTCSLANGSLHISNGSLTITATGTLYVPDGYKVIIEKTNSKLVLEKNGKLIVKKWGFVEKPEYVVSGTLDPDATGTYYYAGIGEEGKPYYKRSDGSYYIFWSGFGSWVVDIGVGYANWYWWRESTDITGVYQTNPIYATGTLTVT